MSIKEYLKGRMAFFIINLILFFSIALTMSLLNVGTAIIFLVFCIWFLPLITYIILELIPKKKYYDDIRSVLEGLDKKYLLCEIINRPDFIEGKIIYDALKETNKDMHENVNKYKNMQLEYKEYIETWVHEIKTPIASTKLIIENNENPITDKINLEVKKVEGFIEQVLYYSRSNDVSKDYIIKEFKVRDAAMVAVKRNSRDFINKKIALNIENIDGIIFSDIKWVEFILNQIIGNAIKYSKVKDGIIKIYSIENKNNIVLNIEDNGVGIIDRDLNRVFEKGFTGENGRTFAKSTGIGLYLCKKLCAKLGIGINIESKDNIGTKVKIIFPIRKFN
ncbi:sensor histidine kinase [Clostridium gasigenes]|uniref:sensor histidine kinase n=1 Tax=Clostridium gasigenes TaxID=94869 RepID=UPI001C0AB0AD|nr:sensor histidine kinase [Clostridium gasigenes]MBU3107298.1 sensor histidine kinase [Clostridium gasigenes]